MKEGEGRRIVAMDAFHVADKSNQKLKAKLTEEEREREREKKKGAATALDSAEKQAESQRILLRNAEDQLATFKEQIPTLKKKLEEVQKAKDQVD